MNIIFWKISIVYSSGCCGQYWGFIFDFHYMFPQCNKQLAFALLSFCCSIPRPITCFHSVTKNFTLLHSVQSQVPLHVFNGLQCHQFNPAFQAETTHQIHVWEYSWRGWFDIGYIVHYHYNVHTINFPWSTENTFMLSTPIMSSWAHNILLSTPIMSSWTHYNFPLSTPLISQGVFTERSTMLLKFDSKEHADQFQTYCKDRELLTRICSTARVQACTCCVVFKFVPCDSSFLPENKEHLRTLESEHNLEEGSIITASWIKKPERCAPNQKTANVKVFCASPIVANHLLRERIFVLNSRIVVIKDTQVPIRCNKCQEYGHIHEQCENAECCANCARPHSTNECNYPNDPHCVSCRTSSKHASSDKGSCPQFAKHASSINTHLPKNTMPYFPVLGQPNTFVLTAKNTHVPTVNYTPTAHIQILTLWTTNRNDKTQHSHHHQPTSVHLLNRNLPKPP